MKCQYCEHLFSTKYVLQSHQKRAKYCIAIQEKMGKQKNSELYECEFCHEKFASNTKSRHSQSCKQRLQILLKNSEEKVKDLEKIINTQEKLIIELQSTQTVYKDAQECLKEIAKQPRVQNNTTNQNKLLLLTPLDLSEDKIKQAVETGFTHDHFLSGQKGVAKFAVDNLLKDNEGKLKYICTDPSRAIFKYRSSQGDVERDVKARKLTDLIADDVIKRSTNLVNDKKEDANPDQFIILLDNYTNIREMIEDNGEFREELVTLTILNNGT